MTEVEERILRNQIEIMTLLIEAFPALVRGRLAQAIIDTEKLMTGETLRQVGYRGWHARVD
jgi:hypothetical protein